MSRPHVALLIAMLVLTACAPSLSEQPMPRRNIELLRERVDNYRRLNRPAQALFVVELLGASNGWTPDLYALAGELREDTRDLAGAVAAWEAIPSPSSDILRSLAAATLALGRWTAARDALAALVQAAPEDTWARLQYGLLLSVTQPAGAREQLAAAAQEPAYGPLANDVLRTLTTYADDAALSMRVGISLANHDQWAFAEIAFDYAAQVFDPYAEALAYAGLARDHQGKDGSVQVIRAVMLEPDNPRVRFLQGLHLRAAGSNRAAIDALNQAAALEPQNPAYFAELAQAYRAEGNLSRAEELLLVAVGLAGTDTRYLEMLALFYADEAQNLTAGGLAALESLRSVLSSDADVQAGYGWALFVAGDSESGLSLIEQVLDIAPDNPRALYYQARILLEQGARDEALGLLERVASGGSEFADEASATISNLGN